MITTAARLDLRRNRSLVTWLVVVSFLYAATMGVLYPVMRENMAALDQYLEIFPKEFLAAFGMTGSLGEPGVFFSTYIGIWGWPILAAIVGTVTGTRPVAADLDRGFLELALSTRISRTQYLGTAIVGQLVVITAVAVSTIVGVVGVGALAGASFDAGRFLMVLPLAVAFGAAVASVATLLSVVTLSRGTATGITVGILVAMYLLYIVGQIQPDLEWLLSLSAFGHFDTAAIIDDGVFPIGDLVLFAVVAVAAWLAALWGFRRRDLAA